LESLFNYLYVDTYIDSIRLSIAESLRLQGDHPWPVTLFGPQ